MFVTQKASQIIPGKWAQIPNIEILLTTILRIREQKNKTKTKNPINVLMTTIKVTNLIEGFHVMSYQANFASHPTRDRHVGFLLHGLI